VTRGFSLARAIFDRPRGALNRPYWPPTVAQLSRTAVPGKAQGSSRQSPGFNPRVFDALRDFSVKYVDLAPESQSIPFPG